MTDKENSSVICKKCGKPFNKEEQGADIEQQYCSHCMIDLAEQYVPEETEMSKLKQIRKSRIGTVLLWVILLACLSIIAIQIPSIMSALEEEKPARYGVQSTDAVTNQCINNLWHISKLLQEGKLPGKDIVCPLSKKPYVVITTEDDVIARCPNPEEHGFKEIQVSKINPIPEIKK